MNPTPKNTTVHDIARAYADLDVKIKETDQDAKTLRRQREVLQDQLIDAMIDEGTSSVDVLTDTGKAKLFVTNRLFARRGTDVSEDDFIFAIESAGLGALVKETVNANKLASAVREIAEEHKVRDSGAEEILKVLPPLLRAAITVQTSPSIGLRRS